MLSRVDYEAVATILRNRRNEMSETIYDYLCNDFATYFQSTNASFNELTFFKATRERN